MYQISVGGLLSYPITVTLPVDLLGRCAWSGKTREKILCQLKRLNHLDGPQAYRITYFSQDHSNETPSSARRVPKIFSLVLDSLLFVVPREYESRSVLGTTNLLGTMNPRHIISNLSRSGLVLTRTAGI